MKAGDLSVANARLAAKGITARIGGVAAIATLALAAGLTAALLSACGQRGPLTLPAAPPPAATPASSPAPAS